MLAQRLGYAALALFIIYGYVGLRPAIFDDPFPEDGHVTIEISPDNANERTIKIDTPDGPHIVKIVRDKDRTIIDHDFDEEIGDALSDETSEVLTSLLNALVSADEAVKSSTEDLKRSELERVALEARRGAIEAIGETGQLQEIEEQLKRIEREGSQIHEGIAAAKHSLERASATYERKKVEILESQHAALEGTRTSRTYDKTEKNADYSGQVLVGENFSNMDLTNADFSKAILTGADFSGSKLTGADFERAKLQGADFKNALLDGSDFTRADLAGANLKRANLSNANLNRANLTAANLVQSNLKNAELDDTVFYGVKLNGALRSKAQDREIAKTFDASQEEDPLLEAAEPVAPAPPSAPTRVN